MNAKELLKAAAQKASGRIAYSVGPAGAGERLCKEAGARFRAASLIKLPILYAYLFAVSDGEFDPAREIEVMPEAVVGGTGLILSMRPGTSLTLSDLALLMIAESDNIATNILIDLLGMERINAQIAALDMTGTILQRKMQDFARAAEGFENYTTADNIAAFLNRTVAGVLAREPIWIRVYEHLAAQNLNLKLPFRLPAGVSCAHKTGDLPRLEHDAGILAKGDRMVVAVALADDLEDNAAGVAFCREVGVAAAMMLD